MANEWTEEAAADEVPREHCALSWQQLARVWQSTTFSCMSARVVPGTSTSFELNVLI